MCAACFEAAAWPWKVCPDCQPARAQAAAARATPSTPTAGPLVCPWCGREGVGLAAERPACPGCGTGMLAAEAGRAAYERRRSAEPPVTSAAAAAPTRTDAPTPARAPRPPVDAAEAVPGGTFMRVFLFLLVVTAIPLVTWSIATGMEGAYASGTRPSLGRGLPSGGPAGLRDTAAWIADASLFAAALGPALALFITVAAWLGGMSRMLLLALFVPGLYLTLGALVLLVGLQGLLVMGTLYLLWIGGVRMPPLLLLVIGLVAAFGVLALVGAMLSSVKRARTAAFGAALIAERAPALWGHVRELAARMGAKPPHHIVVGVGPGFWVTEAEVDSLSGRHRGRTLYLSLPLSRILSKDELTGVLAHELAHFKGLDTRFSHLFYPVYRGTAESLVAIDHATDESVLSWLTLLPAQIVLEYFFKRFAEAESKIGRARELAADRTAAAATDARTVAVALVKAHAFDGFWHDVRGVMRGAATRGQTVPNLSQAYVEIVRQAAVPSVLDGLADDRLPHPTDSHPPLGARLAALGVALDEVGGAALAVSPSDPAIALIDAAEEIERQLSQALPPDALL
jgi:Zn-dependent protease with chaperone function